MVLLDTDHASLLQRDGGAGGDRLEARLGELPPEHAAVSIVTYEEQSRGWLAVMARAKTVGLQVEGYRRLARHLEYYRRAFVIPFDEAAAISFQGLKRAGVRIGTMDLRIAAVALSTGRTLLTRNFVDFRKVPGLKIEDWTT